MYDDGSLSSSSPPTTGSDAPPILKHPVALLIDHLSIVYNCVDAAPPFADPKHYSTLQDALVDASRMASGVGDYLSHGLLERSGAFESELRTVISKLQRSVFNITFKRRGDEGRECWDESVEKFRKLYDELHNVALDLPKWHQCLGDVRRALVDVQAKMRRLANDTDHSDAALKSHEDQIMDALEKFQDATRPVLPHVQFSLNGVNYGHVDVAKLTDGICWCMEQLLKHSESQREDDADSSFEPSELFDNIRNQVRDLLWVIKLTVGDAHDAATHTSQAELVEQVMVATKVAMEGVVGKLYENATPLENLSRNDAAELFSDELGIKKDLARITKEINDGTIELTSDKRLTARAILVRARVIQKNKPQKAQSREEEAKLLHCARCSKSVPRLLGTGKLCQSCVEKSCGIDPDAE